MPDAPATIFELGLEDATSWIATLTVGELVALLTEIEDRPS